MTEANDKTPEQLAAAVSRRPDKLLEYVAAAVASIRFGSVTLVIHDGRVVQIERSEKLRTDLHDGERRPPGSGLR